MQRVRTPSRWSGRIRYRPRFRWCRPEFGSVCCPAGHSGSVQKVGVSRRLHQWRRGGRDRLKQVAESRAERTVVDRTPNLQQQVGASSRPSHLLRLVHPPVDQEVSGTFSHRRSDAQACTVSFSIIDEPSALAAEIVIDLVQRVLQLAGWHTRSAMTALGRQSEDLAGSAPRYPYRLSRQRRRPGDRRRMSPRCRRGPPDVRDRGEPGRPRGRGDDGGRRLRRDGCGRTRLRDRRTGTRGGRFVIRLLALRQPVADDLRKIVAALKITNDLERIGDYAANAAKRSIVLVQYTLPFSLTALANMARMVQQNLKTVIDAVGQRDAGLAEKVWRSDRMIDDLYGSIFRELITYMMEDA